MRGRIKAAALIAFAIGAFLGALPQLIVMLSQTHQFFARAKILSVQADNPVSYAAAVLWNFWLNLEPRYLFIPRGYSDLSIARLLPPEILDNPYALPIPAHWDKFIDAWTTSRYGVCG